MMHSSIRTPARRVRSGVRPLNPSLSKGPGGPGGEFLKSITLMVIDKVLIALLVGGLLIMAKDHFEQAANTRENARNDASNFREFLRNESPALNSDLKQRFNRLVETLEHFQDQTAKIVYSATNDAVLDLQVESDRIAYVDLIRAELEININIALLKQWDDILDGTQNIGNTGDKIESSAFAINDTLPNLVNEVIEALIENDGLNQDDFEKSAKDMNLELTKIRITVREIILELSRQHYQIK